jgi:hypothetical protein
MCVRHWISKKSESENLAHSSCVLGTRLARSGALLILKRVEVAWFALLGSSFTLVRARSTNRTLTVDSHPVPNRTLASISSLAPSLIRVHVLGARLACIAVVLLFLLPSVLWARLAPRSTDKLAGAASHLRLLPLDKRSWALWKWQYRYPGTIVIWQGKRA